MNNDVIKVQLSCGVDYYKGDKGDKPVKGVDYFTQEDIDDIVAQIETGGVDLDGYATKEYVDNAVSGVVVSETDPTVPAWAKQANKPSYTANEVGALPADTQLFSGDYNDLSNKPAIPTVPANVSAFNNDAGYLTNVEFHDTINNTSVSVNSVGLYVETLDNEQNPVYRTDVLNMGVSANGPSGGVAIGDGQLIFVEPTNGNMLEVTIDENGDSLYVNGDKVALVNDIPNLTGYATESYVDTAIANIDIPAPIVIECGIAGQPTVDSNGNCNYILPLTITSNNMAEAYEQFQTHPSTVGISVDLSAMGISTKMYMDCESFYRADDGNGGYNYETYGEFNDSSLAWRFGFEFDNVNIYLNTETNSSEGRLIGLATVNQLASKANSADLATVATSGDYNDLTNKPTIPTAYTLPTASTSTLGGVKVDGSTITITDGVISATSSGGSNYTFTNGLTENNGTVSWNLNDRVQAGTGTNSVKIGDTSNLASGKYSFAEGSHTWARADYTHAEGEQTTASGKYSHVEGRANTTDNYNVFQNIAGNGTSNANRSTMFARDWNGNEYLSGNLFVGCNDFTTTSSGLTTADAGGSKVATESYVATAIANIPSGTTYTAGQGISIDNGEISLDFGNEIENGSFIFTQHYDNEDFYEYTTNMSPNEINLTSYGEADPETGDQETKSILITGEGITFDDTGDTHTLGVSNGELVFDDSPIGSGGGSSYTAGQGINIDSNGVISAKPSYSGHYGINGLWSFWREEVNPTGGYMETVTVTSAEQAVECLLKGLVIQQNSNIKIDLRDIIDIHPDNGDYLVVRFNLATKKTYDRSTYGASDNYQYTLSRFNYYVKLDNFTLLELTQVSQSTIYPSGLLPYFIIHQSPNYTTYNVAENLDEVMETVNTRIPTAPTTDGNYVLKVSVSSGTPTYSWVAE